MTSLSQGFKANPGLELANTFGVKTLSEKQEVVGLLRRKLREDEDQNQKSSCIKEKAGEAFDVMTNLKYSALSIRAAEVLGPTVTAIPASRSVVMPFPLTPGFGSVVQHTTLFT